MINYLYSKELMKFGTTEFEANKPFFEKKSVKKRVLLKKTKEKVEPFSLPQLPKDWVKETLTGSISYDQTVSDISSQLKRTLVIKI